MSDQLYNSDIKEEYLGTIPENTAKVYRSVLHKVADTEEILDKDLHDFTTNEIKDTLINGNYTTINSIVLARSVFESYYKWASGRGLTSSNINIISLIPRSELNDYLDKSKKLYFSEDEIVEMENNLENYQDKVILRLVFEGISGQGASEILNLKTSDIEGNTLTLQDDKTGNRQLEVSDRAIDFIEKAADETVYYNKNGTVEGRRETSNLEITGYVFKSSARGRERDNERADRHTVYRRLTMVSEFFEYPYLTLKNIQKSGMIKMAKDLYLQNGKLDKEEYNMIADRFNITKNVRTMSPNITLLKQVVNRENILDLYGIDIGE